MRISRGATLEVAKANAFGEDACRTAAGGKDRDEGSRIYRPRHNLPRHTAPVPYEGRTPQCTHHPIPSPAPVSAWMRV
jgi:hypothetical protein